MTIDTLTVVIPTYNRAGVLKKALDAYKKQSAPESIRELIVVDDGSTDGTENIVLQMRKELPFPVRYLRQSNKGPAAARNAGIREAASELILFTDDDIIPERTLVAQHLAWHNTYPDRAVALMGNLKWDADVEPTPFMGWYGSEALFCYASFAGRTELEYIYFYTCNVSLKTQFLRINNGFDEDFKVAAWEDSELGFRLNKAGMRLLYNSEALAYHHQYISFDDACRRHKKALEAHEVFKRKEAGRSQAAVKTSRLNGRLKKLLASALFPLKSLMDWRLPLPWSVYRMMFRIYR
ncbi:MAG: glycosyltransferase [Candidatus Acidiferrum sp.]|jgi:glycosyltransferase involved in cell wall biosynthesis